jgi:hypothetical protein
VGALSFDFMNPRPALAVLAAAATLTACAAAPQQPSAASSPRTPPVRCSVAPAATVSSALALQVDAPKEINNDPVTVCTYLPKARSYAVVLRFQTDVTPAVFAAGKSGNLGSQGVAAPLPGFQDEAYSGTSTGGGVTTNTLAARKGSVEIVVTSTATVDQEKALVSKLFAAL